MELLQVRIFIQYHKIMYTRVFTKLQDVLANMGGIFKAVSFLLWIFCHYYNKFSGYDFIANWFFDYFNTNEFEVRNNSKLSNDDFQSNYEHFRIIFHKRNSSNQMLSFESRGDTNNAIVFKTHELDFKQIEKQINDDLLKLDSKRKNYKIRSGCIINFYYIFNCANKINTSKVKNKLIKVIRADLYEKLEILHYLKLCRQMEYLISFILDKTQLICLEFSKVNLYNKLNQELTKSNSELDKILEIINYFISKNSINELNQMDLQLILKMNPMITKHIFK